MSTGIEGYVYISSQEVGVMSHAREGANICLRERKPPWIVVDHSIGSNIVARWSGRLWRVVITDAAGIEQASARARYTRTFAVQVLGELPVSRLFGERGEAVCSVIETSGRLELAQIHSLASARHPAAADAYSRAWNDWLASAGGTDAYRNEDLTGTVAISAGGSASPIHHGLSVLHQAISDRAEQLVGSSAFIVEEDGDKYLEPTWSSAGAALLEAAMAFGAPHVSDADRQIMSAAWYSVFGVDPGASKG